MAPGGGVSNGWTQVPSISADGRYVAYQTTATNLLPEVDQNGEPDVYLHDRVTRTTSLVSRTPAGLAASGGSHNPVISADGRFVAFSSGASDLVPGDVNEQADVFVFDRLTEQMERVSVSSAGAELDLPSNRAGISGDGRFVVFNTSAAVFPEDVNLRPDIHVLDRRTGTIELVSVSIAGTSSALGASSMSRSISADGRFVVFHSASPDLVQGDTFFGTDVFVRDRLRGVTELVSVGVDGRQGEYVSANASISADGSRIVFISHAASLVPGDDNGAWDVFVRDRAEDTTSRVNVTSQGVEGGTDLTMTVNATISPDGRYVGIATVGTLLVAGDENDYTDVFIHDLEVHSTEVVSVNDDATQGGGFSPDISSGGRFVAFAGSMPVTITESDAFVRDRGPHLGFGGLDVTTAGGSVHVDGWATFSGTSVAVATDAAGEVASVAGDRAGMDLIGVELISRPELNDILVRWRPKDLPGPRGSSDSSTGSQLIPGKAGAPRVVYGLDLFVNGVRYEVRATPLEEDPEQLGAAFRVLRCDPSCEEVTRVPGGVGESGIEVRTAVPLGAMSADPGETITGLRAWTALDASPPVPLDEVRLLDAAIPVPSVSFALAPDRARIEEVRFGSPVPLVRGRFARTMDLPESSHPSLTLWARACLGDRCTYERRPLG